MAKTRGSGPNPAAKRFEIFLPAGGSPPPSAVRRKGPKAKPDRKSAPTSAPGEAASRTVLIVEDEGLLRSSLKDLIEADGYRVITAPDGIEAVRLYREHRSIDVVVSDLQMPKLGGWESFLRLKECDPAARVILLSGDFQEHRRAEMMEAGVAACISKPFHPAEMLVAIERAIGPSRGD